MEKKYMQRFVGRYCKIVTKEPGEERANVVSGILEDVDYKDGFIIVDSSQGLGCLRIDTIIAIKPGNKNRDKKSFLKDEDHAMIGIGTLIVFIAMVLVAAVAASVIIQTAEDLQQRAYAVGKQTTRDVSSGMKVIDITGYTNEAKTKIEYLAISIKPRAGSYDIDLNETLLYIEFDNLKVLHLNYVNSDVVTGTVNSTGIFNTLNHSNLNATRFGLIALHDSDNSVANSYGMSTNDLAMIIVNLTAAFPDTSGIGPGQDFYGRIIPEVGSSGIFLVNTPAAYDHRVVEL